MSALIVYDCCKVCINKNIATLSAQDVFDITIIFHLIFVIFSVACLLDIFS